MPSANVVQTSVSGGQQNALALQGDGVFLPKLSTAARTALTLGNSDKGFLAYDTTDNNVYIWNGAAWESIPASGDSSNTQVIFNDNGILAGDAGLTYDKATDSLTVGGNLTVNTNTLFVNSANNRVGVNTASPATDLEVRSIAFTEGTIRLYSAIDGSNASPKGSYFSFRSGTTGGGIETARLSSLNRFVNVSGGDFSISTADTSNVLQNRLTIDSGGVFTFAVGGSTAMTLNSTGLGLGVASPSARLHVKSTNGLLINESTGDVTGAGTTFLSLVDANGQAGYYGFAGDGSSSLSVWNKKSGSLLFATGNTLRATIDSTGNMLVGTTNTSATAGVGFKSQFSSTVPQFAIVVNEAGTSSSLSIYNVNAAAYRFYVNNGGTVFATNTTISAISDARLKENVQDIDVGLGAILALKPRKFDWKAGKGKDIKGDRGFIAQEFEQVFPNLIDEWKDEAPKGEAPYKSVRQDLIPVLVKAIQELAAKVQALEAKLA